ncbi:MAG: hypothetical protein NVS9B15_17430 [Acidobacteriaceae bacterium]
MSSRVDAILLAPVSRRVEQIATRHYEDIYEGNRHRIFSLAFYMTYSECEAEELMEQTFCRAFRAHKKPSAEHLDRALVSELRETRPIGVLTLTPEPVTEPTGQIRRNTKRADLEAAVVQLPPTERAIFLMHDVESYDHARIARTIGITEDESKRGLFHARLAIRKILAAQQPS